MKQAPGDRILFCNQAVFLHDLIIFPRFSREESTVRWTFTKTGSSIDRALVT